MGEDLAGVAGEEGEEAELLGGQVERGPRGRRCGGGRRRGRRRPCRRGRGRSGRRRPVVAQRDPQSGEQLGGGERLGDVVVGAVVERRDLAVLGALGGEHDDRHVRPGPDAPEHLDAVDVGQPEVEDDGRRAVAGRRRPAPGCRWRHCGPVAAGRERALKARVMGGSSSTTSTSRLAEVAVSSGRCGTGSVNVNRAPAGAGAASSTLMVPPWASTMALQMARPTPDDRLPRARCGTARRWLDRRPASSPGPRR